MSVETMGRIQPWTQNRGYWQYHGEPILLLGGTIDHNLFQLPDLEEHLDLLVSCGGNYVRNTMSAREKGNVWPFARVSDDGRYDLERPNPEYWHRVERLLTLAHDRDIIVQIELWDRFDFYREPWLDNPFNPKNNVNYSSAEARLADDYPMHPGRNENPFFLSVAEADDNPVLLPHQQRFVDQLLSTSLRYDNVLYCMDNETNGIPEWGAYWSRYVKESARQTGGEVETTEMWDSWQLTDPQHLNTFDHPDLYTFVDVSQNNHNSGQAHWDQLRDARARILRSERVRPMNNVKIYGADGGRFGDDRDGVERFWRNIFGGCASARFHRPPSGLGLNPRAQAQLRSARLLAQTVPVWQAESRDDLLIDRSDNGAYCLCRQNDFCAVYLPAGGDVSCDVSLLAGAGVSLSVFDLARSSWQDRGPVQPRGGLIELSLPPADGWVALLRAG